MSNSYLDRYLIIKIIGDIELSKRALGLELSASLNLGCKLRDKKEAFSSRINYHKCSHSHGQNHITCNKLAIPGNYFNVPIALDLKKKKKKV